MLKNQVERPGRRSISSFAARDSTAPARARPRSAGPAQSQTLVTVTTWPLVWVNRGSVCVFVQEPRHLQYVADLGDLNVYTVVNSRKLYGAPTDFTFCIKVSFFFFFFLFMFVQSPLQFSIPLACVVFVAHWVNKDHFHLSHEEGNGWINDGSEAMTVNLHAQNQNSFAEMWHHSCFLYCRLAAELKTHMGKIWPGGWIEMVRSPVPDILKGKLNDTQKSLQAAAWCACGAATLSKFINDTKYSLTRSCGANIGFLVIELDVRGRHHLGLGFAKMEHWLSSCCRFWLEGSSISQWTTMQWVSQQLNSSVSQ